jgi:hypothetical protein
VSGLELDRGWAERHRGDIAAARTAYDARPANPAA